MAISNDYTEQEIAQRGRRPQNIAARFSLADLKDQFGAMSRQPFVEILAHFMQCAPTSEAIEAFSNEYPDRWAKTLQTMARLSGYTDHLEITENIHLTIQHLGDADLIAKIADLDRELAIEDGHLNESEQISDAEFTELSESEEETVQAESS